MRQDTTGWEKVIMPGIVQEIEIWPHEQMVYAPPRIRPRKLDTQNFLEFWDQTDHLDDQTKR